jgi:hypothetical protein
MKKAVFVLLVVFSAVSFLSCGKKIDFFDLRVLEFNEGATAYGKAYSKLNTQEKKDYYTFKQKLTDEDFFDTIVAKQELFPSFNKAMGKFMEAEAEIHAEIESKVLNIQNRISDLQSAGIIQNRRRIDAAFMEYDTALRNYSNFRDRTERQYNQFSLSINQWFDTPPESLPEEFATEELMTRIEAERLKYETKKYMMERYKTLSEERTAFREENDQLQNVAREEAERRRQEQIALANKRAEQNRIEKERRGGEVQALSINRLSNNRWLYFYIMKDGSGTFDSKFNVDSYINKENIKFGWQTGIVNRIIYINGESYALFMGL